MEIMASYVRMTNVQVKRTQYADGSLAVLATGIDAEGDYDQMKLSVNLSAYNISADAPNMFYCKNYSECEGLPDALEKSSIAKKIKKLENLTPYDSEYWIMELNENV